MNNQTLKMIINNDLFILIIQIEIYLKMNNKIMLN